jgi:WD40 repeat protein/DNA-binding SARP family transcriptional activator
MAQLSITLFGPFRVRQGGEEVIAFKSNKVRGLLAYLAVESQRLHRRDSLAALLWPDWTDKEARTNLRYALSNLRSTIGDREAEPAYLNITREAIQFNTESNQKIDVGDFSQVLSVNGSGNPTVEQLEKAVDLYQGEFLEGFSISDSPPFQDWMLLKREQLHRQLVDALRLLSATYQGQEEFERALLYARRQVELEPWQEDGHRQVMLLLAESGQIGAALAQYETCRQLLKTDLGTEPSEQTVALYSQIKNGTWGTSVSSADGIREQKVVHIGESPYRGLAAFREQDAPFFFGRDRFTAQLLDAIQHHSMVSVIIGQSGSGKSSLAHAGLIPQLRAQGSWMITHFRPGAHPLLALSGALIPLLEPDLSEVDQLVESEKLAKAFKEGSLSLHQLVERVLAKQPEDQRMLLFVDQFEELFTISHEIDAERVLLDELLETIEIAADKRSYSFALLLTLRADFMSQALAYRPFADLLQEASLMLGPMIREEMRAAIEKPAEIQGASFEEGLIERILNEVGKEPGNLPLLEFALTLLWEQAESGILTHASYERIGQVEGALARYAESVYETLDNTEQQAARQIFVQLVSPGEATEDTRRIASRIEIGEQNWPLTQFLADKRLVVTGQDSSGNQTVEVVHEALIASWQQLKDWMEADRAFRTWQERLRTAIRLWETADQDESTLLHGVALAEAEVWLAERQSELSDTEIAFVYASVEMREYRLQQQEERHRRELEAAQKLAEAEEQRAQEAEKRAREQAQAAARLRQRAILLTGIGIIAVVLAVFAGLQWRQANLQRVAAQQAEAVAEEERDQSQQALAGLLAAQSLNLVDSQYELAMLLGVESIRRADSMEGRGSLYRALTQNPNLVTILHAHQEDVRSLAFHPNGRLMASGDQDGLIYLWELDTGQQFGNPLEGHQGQVSSLAFSPDGLILASGGFDDAIILWDVDESSDSFGQLIGVPIRGHGGNVWDVSFSPDGRLLASGSADKKIILWDVSEGSVKYDQASISILNGHDGIVTSLAFSPDGGTLASGSADKTVILWDINTRVQVTAALQSHEAFVSSIAFSPDGRTLASSGKDNTVRLWDVDQGSASFGQLLREPLSGHTETVWDLAFSPIGNQLASGSEDGTVQIWDADQASVTFGQSLGSPLTGHAGPVFAVDFSQDGGRLVTGAADRAVILWDPARQDPLIHQFDYFKDTALFLDVVYRPDGAMLAFSSNDSTIYLLGTRTSATSDDFTQVTPLKGHSKPVLMSQFSPDGKLLASGSDDRTIILWDVDEASPTFGQPIGTPLTGHSSFVQRLAFSSDGRMLASGDYEGEIRLWNLSTGEKLALPMLGNSLSISALAFSPDGKILASAGRDKFVRMWDVDQESAMFGQQIGSALESRTGVFSRLLFSPDGAKLIGGDEDGNIQIWDMDRDSNTYGQRLDPPLSDHQSVITGLSLTPDGKYLVSSELLGTILIWELETGRTIKVPVQHVDEVTIQDSSLSQEGDSLAVLFRTGSVILIDLNLDSWQQLACQRANRNLTQEEWQQFFGEEPYRKTCGDAPAIGS